ncbi:hypothetical protein G7Y79_00027g060020 [Physcia stellaris]|nr:hypothetical protein G7Y79_00027g060020 [Physcia stellaris]
MDATTLPSPQSASIATHEAFQSRYDLNDPVAAMHSYAESMRKFTQQQMDGATRSSTRRTSAHAVSSIASLSAESSIDSTKSNQSYSSHS